MAITPAPGWMIDPNNSNGVVQINAINPATGIAYGAPTATPSGVVTPTPAPTPTPTPAPTPTPSPTPAPAPVAPVTQPAAKPVLSQAMYDTARSYIQSGALTPAQAQAYLQGYISSGAYSGSVASSLLYAPLSVVQGGITYALNPDGTLKQTNATVQTNVVGAGGTTSTTSTAMNPMTPTPTTATPAAGAAAPTVALQPGSTDTASVTALQNYLVANGYMTQAQMNTGPGIYGPQTTAAVAALQQKLGVDNSSGVGDFGPKTMAAIAAASTSPAVAPVGNVIDGSQVGTAGSTTLPSDASGSAGTTFSDSMTSISSTIAAQKASLDQALAQQTAQYQSQIDALNASKSDLQALSDAGMAAEGSTAADETAQKQAALDEEQQQYTDNYNASQALVDELDGLLTQGNAVVTQMQNTTGLSSIMTPEISKTMSDISARVGVIQAVLSARSGQIGLAQSQLTSSLNAISSISNDQINYYQNLVSYYNTESNNDQSQIDSLTSDQQTYVKAQITELQDNLTQTQTTASQISAAMLDPNTALLYAKAGVTLNDSPSQVAQKIATASYASELSTTANKMAAAGYSSTPIPGVTPVTTTDSQGNTKNWYKDDVTQGAGGTVGAGGSGTGGSSVKIPTGAPISTTSTDIAQGAQILDNSKTATNSQGVSGDGKYADPTIYLQMFQTWLAHQGTAKSFQAAYPYTTYINPANTWLLADMQAAEGTGGAASGAQTP